jgi:hypothetical protein
MTIVKTGRFSVFLIMLLLGAAQLDAAPSTSQILKAVVRITGHNASSEPVMGSGFLVRGPRTGQVWLITAAHIFNIVKSANFKLLLRLNSAAAANTGIEFEVPLQKAGHKLYKAHRQYDLAALLVAMPANAAYNVLSPDMFAREEDFKTGNVEAGSSLLIFGYPYGSVFGNTGYAMVRSGIISSFPLLPVREFPCFLADFEVFEGNSGSLVVFSGQQKKMVAGMVLEEVFLEELRPGKKNTLLRRHGLGLARVLNADIIKKFIEGLH